MWFIRPKTTEIINTNPGQKNKQLEEKSKTRRGWPPINAYLTLLVDKARTTKNDIKIGKHDIVSHDFSPDSDSYGVLTSIKNQDRVLALWAGYAHFERTSGVGGVGARTKDATRGSWPYY